MFLLVTKIVGIFLTPSNVLAAAGLAGALALWLRWRRTGTTLVWIAAVGLFASAYGPIGFILLRPLEDRFPRPPDNMPEPDGIIVLGGVVSFPTFSRGAISLTRDGERLGEAAALAHRYPNTTLVLSGGTPGLSPEASNEAFVSKRFLVSLGVEESRIMLDPRSLSTSENAIFTRDLIKPQAGQRWLLVTSAWHMPRAVGSFTRAGFPVIPYPVGYVTAGLPSDYWRFGIEPSEGLVRTNIAVHEWVGLIVYWLTGRTETLLPGPEPGHS